MKLNQVIAVEKGIKQRVMGEIDTLYKAVQKPVLFDGFRKSYQKVKEDSEALPPQQQKVQFNANAVLDQAASKLNELFDITAAKDWANCAAKADISIDGEVVLTGVPSTYLLFLEKQLTDLHTFVGKLPVLDPAEDWEWDSVKQVWATKPTQTARTNKVPKPIVLYPATPEHPAQTQLISEDIIVGHWDQVKFSGAVTEAFRNGLAARIEKLQRAVKFAREQANTVDAPAQAIGEKLLAWIFKGGTA